MLTIINIYEPAKFHWQILYILKVKMKWIKKPYHKNWKISCQNIYKWDQEERLKQTYNIIIPVNTLSIESNEEKEINYEPEHSPLRKSIKR